MNDLEQAEPEIDETSQAEGDETVDSNDQGSEPTDGISDIFEKALKGKTTSSEDSGSEVEEEPEEEQAEESEEGEQEESDDSKDTPFGILELEDAKRLKFKSKEEWAAFLERNPFLKSQVLMQSDYTKKATSLAQERNKFLEERKSFEDEKVKSEGQWGKNKPTSEDMSFFQNLWHLFQYGSDDLASKIATFARDVHLIANGQNPTGFLKGSAENGEKIDYSKDGHLIKLQREFEQYKSEQERKEKEHLTRQQETVLQQARTEIDQWLSEKKKANVPIIQEDLQTMALFGKVRDAEGKRLSLDEMYDLAMVRLGKYAARVKKNVVKNAKDASSKTPHAPASKGTADMSGKAQTLDEIFEEGLKKI